jgi:SAM-dependent methyltransferase
VKPFPWPVPPGGTEAPVWTGAGFRMGDTHLPMLAYPTGACGWADELSDIHEETVGVDHFMGVASRRHTLEQLERNLTTSAPVILEIGSLSGFLLEDVPRSFPDALLIGADADRASLEQIIKKRQDVPLMQFDLLHCPLPDGCVDAVVMLNVLEHIKDDAGALRQIRRILKPGGLLVLEVPAGPRLYDVYDKVFMHHRRYDLDGLTRLMEAERFRISFASHLGTLLYPGFWLVKMRNRRYLEAPPELQRQVVTRSITTTSRPIMHWIMSFERQLRNFVHLPFGIRCLVTAKSIAGT